MLARFKILDLDSRVVDVWDLWVQPIWEEEELLQDQVAYPVRTDGLCRCIEILRGRCRDKPPDPRLVRHPQGRGRSHRKGRGEDDLFTNGWRMFDFLRDDGDFEIPSLFGEVLLEDQARHSIDNSPAAQMREFCKLREVGGSSKDPFLPVIPSRSC